VIIVSVVVPRAAVEAVATAEAAAEAGAEPEVITKGKQTEDED